MLLNKQIFHTFSQKMIDYLTNSVDNEPYKRKLYIQHYYDDYTTEIVRAVFSTI